MKKSYLQKAILSFSVLLISSILFFQWNFNQSIDSQRRKKHTLPTAHTKGLPWRSFSKEQIEKDRENGYNVFVSIGAEWCLTCKINERIFNDDKVKHLFKTNNVKLYYGDWTNRNPYITRFLNSYGQSGIPFYILYRGKNQTKLLSNFLFKQKVLKNLEEIFQ